MRYELENALDVADLLELEEDALEQLVREDREKEQASLDDEIELAEFQPRRGGKH
jgi:hypothetical protein